MSSRDILVSQGHVIGFNITGLGNTFYRLHRAWYGPLLRQSINSGIELSGTLPKI